MGTSGARRRRVESRLAATLSRRNVTERTRRRGVRLEIGGREEVMAIRQLSVTLYGRQTLQRKKRETDYGGTRSVQNLLPGSHTCARSRTRRNCTKYCTKYEARFFEADTCIVRMNRCTFEEYLLPLVYARNKVLAANEAFRTKVRGKYNEYTSPSDACTKDGGFEATAKHAHMW